MLFVLFCFLFSHYNDDCWNLFLSIEIHKYRPMSVNFLIHRQICIHQNDLSCYEYTHISSSRSNNTIRNNRNDNDHFLTFYFKELSTLDVYEFVCVH